VQSKIERIKACLNGGRLRNEHPAVPVTPGELAAEAAAAVAAGKPHARTIVSVIGPQTAATATEFGLRVDVQGDVAQVDCQVDALAAHAARLRAEGALPPPRKTKRARR
jgi:uroporphyrinogen-III synthase